MGKTFCQPKPWTFFRRLLVVGTSVDCACFTQVCDVREIEAITGEAKNPSGRPYEEKAKSSKKCKNLWGSHDPKLCRGMYQVGVVQEKVLLDR